MSDKKHEASTQAIGELLNVINALLAPDGCPWDREQTPRSMCDYLAEEAFELIEGIRCGDTREAMEELGDVLFIVLMIATLYEREGEHTLTDSARYSAAKMVRRHPHVFGGKDVDGVGEILDNWEAIKRKENEKVGRKRVFDSLPKGLPPLLKAYRINSKAARNQFTWDTDETLEGQLADEWTEWQEALASGDKEASEQEFGDYLFTLVELGRRKGIKANSALDFANQKFLARFGRMEELAEMRGLELASLSLEEMNGLWDEVKNREKG